MKQTRRNQEVLSQFIGFNLNNSRPIVKPIAMQLTIFTEQKKYSEPEQQQGLNQSVNDNRLCLNDFI